MSAAAVWHQQTEQSAYHYRMA